MFKISFFENEVISKLVQRKQLKLFIGSLFEKEKRALQHIDFIFCSDAYLLQININSLQHNYYTDIITFELSKKMEPTVAEIYISVDRVRDNAKQFNASYPEELHRVIFHGCLHLCGYGDKKKKDQAMMRKKENEYLQQYFN